MKRTYITEQGKIELENKIQTQIKRIEEIRKEKNIAYEVSGDGWHDNPGFNQLVQLEERAVNELRSMQRKLSEVIVIQVNERNTSKVGIGSIVKIKINNLLNNQSRETIYEIVGSGESDAANCRISYDSPIGNALLGMEKGNVKQVFIPAGKSNIEVIDFYPHWDLVKE